MDYFGVLGGGKGGAEMNDFESKLFLFECERCHPNPLTIIIIIIITKLPKKTPPKIHIW